MASGERAAIFFFLQAPALVWTQWTVADPMELPSPLPQDPLNRPFLGIEMDSRQSTTALARDPGTPYTNPKTSPSSPSARTNTTEEASSRHPHLEILRLSGLIDDLSGAPREGFSGILNRAPY